MTLILATMYLTHEDLAFEIMWPRILRTNSAGNNDKAAESCSTIYIYTNISYIQ